ncbi:MAG TPA: hypothetical protein VKE69_05105 [Planctomycetota bacterium]|nr:hypothetical protein [Planctomycetota bacterium]
MRPTPLLPFALLATSALASAQGAFPGEPGVNVGLGLPTNFESSGVVWHPRLQKLVLVGDEGHLATMEANGSLVSVVSVAGDLEAVTIADPQTNFVYVGVESPVRVLEVNVITGAVLRIFDLSPWIVPTGNEGMEGLTFVPDPANPEGGLFHAAHQGEGRVYVFSLPVKTSATSTAVTFLSSYVPIPGLSDLSDLGYDSGSDRIYATYDDPNVIAALSKTGTLQQFWTLPGAAQEGVCVRGCELFIAEDQSRSVIRYAGFPSAASCPLLSQDAAALSIAQHGTAIFTLRAQPPVAPGQLYVLLGSATGETPGFDLLGVHVPLVPDSYFETITANANTSVFVTTAAPFGPTLKAEARLALPVGLAPSFAGVHFHHAWISIDVPGGFASAVSNPVDLVLVP